MPNNFLEISCENFGHMIKLPYNSTLRAFGRQLNKSLIKRFPHIYKSQKDTFALLRNFEFVILTEIEKHLPSAQIPKITIVSPEPNLMIIKYESDLPLADIAEGMLLSTIDYYDERINVVGYDIVGNDKNKRQFILTKQN